MTKQQLEKLIEHEIQWLSYYGWYEDRALLTKNSDIYKDLRPMGYAKRPIALMERCAPGLVSSENPITIETSLEDVHQAQFPKEGNKISPLEAYFILYPDEKEGIIKRLIPTPRVDTLFTRK